MQDEIRITKLEKEKQFMKDVCRSRSKTIKELEKQLEEYEKCCCTPKIHNGVMEKKFITPTI